VLSQVSATKLHKQRSDLAMQMLAVYRGRSIYLSGEKEEKKKRKKGEKRKKDDRERQRFLLTLTIAC